MTPVITQQLAPVELAPFCETLASQLMEAGHSGTDLNAVFAMHVVAECPQCKLKFTGEEIRRFSMSGGETNTKTARLKLGYCGRNGCNSQYYIIQLLEHPLIDWTAMLSSTAGQPVAVSAEPEPANSLSRTGSSSRWLRIGIGVVLILALLLIRHVMMGGRIPILQPKHDYKVDPASVTTPKRQ